MVTNTKIDARSSSTQTAANSAVIALVPWLSYWSLHPHRLLYAVSGDLQGAEEQKRFLNLDFDDVEKQLEKVIGV